MLAWGPARREQGHRRPGRDRGQSGCGLADGVDEVFRFGVLEQVSDGAGFQRRQDSRLLGEGGEDDNAGGGTSRQHVGGGLDAVHAGHREVH